MAGDGKGMMGGGKSAIADIIETSDEIRSLLTMFVDFMHGVISHDEAQAWLEKKYPGYKEDYLTRRPANSDQGELPLGS